MNEVIERLREAAPAAFAEEPVAFAFLFGSHADGTTTPRSDVYVAVHLRSNTKVDTLALRLRMASVLERAAGIGPVEVVVLDEAPLALAGRVLERGRVSTTDESSR